MGTLESDLQEAIVQKDAAYEEFDIPKQNGGVRKICAAKKESALFRIQKNFQSFYLKQIVIPVCVKGFCIGGSYNSYLEEHCGNSYFLRIDIKDFFPSISGAHVKKAFEPLIRAEKEERDWILNSLVEILTYDDKLPQGAVTSPFVSNLVFARLDQRILKYCQSLGVRYSRYADDLLFSENNPQGRILSKRWFLKKIRYILSSENYQLNYSKIKRSSDEISLNGFVVGTTVRLSRKRFTDIAAVISCCEKNLPFTDRGANLLFEVNKLPLKYRDLCRYPFGTIHNLSQYLIGYRAYLIGWSYNTAAQTQKRIAKVIRNIEHILVKLDTDC